MAESVFTTEELRRAISHDLRQPLTALMTRADLLRMRLETQGLQADVCHAVAIGESARRMDDLIEEIVVRIGRSIATSATP